MKVSVINNKKDENFFDNQIFNKTFDNMLSNLANLENFKSNSLKPNLKCITVLLQELSAKKF